MVLEGLPARAGPADGISTVRMVRTTRRRRGVVIAGWSIREWGPRVLDIRRRVIVGGGGLRAAVVGRYGAGR